jgi:hypothetical protein
MDIDVMMIDNMHFTIQYLPGIQDYLVHDDFDMYYLYLREIENIYNYV